MKKRVVWALVITIAILLAAQLSIAQVPAPPPVPASLGGDADAGEELPPEPLPIDAPESMPVPISADDCQAELNEVKQRVNELETMLAALVAEPVTEMPAKTSSPAYMIVLAAMNVLFVTIIVFLLVKTRKPKAAKEKQKDELHGLKDYIKQNIKAGMSLAELKTKLLASGWGAGQLDQAMRGV